MAAPADDLTPRPDDHAPTGLSTAFPLHMGPLGPSDLPQTQAKKQTQAKPETSGKKHAG